MHCLSKKKIKTPKEKKKLERVFAGLGERESAYRQAHLARGRNFLVWSL